MSMRVNVLDHGFVELLDVMGDDAEPSRIGRVKPHDNREWSQDARLIKYMRDHEHTSPFEMVEAKWYIKAPIFVARQWVRHRTANWNEYSMRYSPAIRDYHIPETYRLQDTNNRQSSTGALEPDKASYFRSKVIEHAEFGYKLYDEMIEAGIGREQAREHLGLNTYTEWVWKNDLHNTLHFLTLRVASDAQDEIAVYGKVMVELLRERLPKLMEIVWPSSAPAT